MFKSRRGRHQFSLNLYQLNELYQRLLLEFNNKQKICLSNILILLGQIKMEELLGFAVTVIIISVSGRQMYSYGRFFS